MRILNQSFQSQSKSKSAPKKVAPSLQEDIGIGKSGDRKIVKMHRPERLSDAEVRAKIEELKNEKNEVKKVVKQNNIVSTMPDDIKIKNASSIIKKNDGTDKSSIEKEKKIELVKPQTEPLQSEPEAKKNHTLKSDVDANDPRDSNVHEKLKTILKVGGFNFSQKEKEALGEILNK